MKNKKYVLLTAIMAILLSLPILCSTTAAKKTDTKTDNTTQQQTAVSEPAGYFKDSGNLNKLTNMINIIQQKFVGKKNPTKQELYEYAMTGLVNGLDDPYSEYLTKKDLESFTEDLDGEYVGVGMSIDKKKDAPLVVVSPFVGSPAAKAGMKIGDKVTKVDKTDIIPLNATETVNLLKGKQGTKVDVEVVREGVKNPFTVTIIRDTIKLEMVESKMLPDQIGYVSLLKFGNHTGAELKKHIEQLQAQGMKGLILDLRSNPGGSLKEAQDISSLFLTQDLVVYLKYKNGQETRYNRTMPSLGNFPLIILVNGGSASASEIVTGAIKDYKRGTIIGQKTFGKGIVQEVIPLEGGDAIKLTVAQYFTPNGNYIHEKGIEPDIKVDMEEVLSIKGYANDSEEARENRMKEIRTYLEKEKGKEETDKIISAGDVQLKRATEEMEKKIK
ncbi:Probable CtpA-like serine protease [Sebaldella termitidis]|uniref:Carboxyl-terminal protease n=1 Tax=Sebaldella termitidis (strain ATCC 33386 / NCTC 11300) TaxID=526218 RepID=D1AKQ3_SEBTE|nr:S41 family peptidase [Sebaldella termitidis]ACZ07069.1 carboxyl-terminal protease [Sebaldella termitidis ATCC 33386]MBP7979071.1 S41 family peptidase [Sebaldella sp.]SUI22359.1 Probable CtpA-like serine protease [Sebaldella termitidis]